MDNKTQSDKNHYYFVPTSLGGIMNIRTKGFSANCPRGMWLKPNTKVYFESVG
jgi:hypothetical protein